MKSPNDKTIVLNAPGPDDEDQDLRALITVDLEEDEEDVPQQVDEFANEFLLQVSRGFKPVT
jgi:hypothetical protein